MNGSVDAFLANKSMTHKIYFSIPGYILFTNIILYNTYAQKDLDCKYYFMLISILIADYTNIMVEKLQTGRWRFSGWSAPVSFVFPISRFCFFFRGDQHADSVKGIILYWPYQN